MGRDLSTTPSPSRPSPHYPRCGRRASPHFSFLDSFSLPLYLLASLLPLCSSRDEKSVTATPLESALTKNAGCPSLFLSSFRSLHQEYFTSLFQSCVSALFQKNTRVAGVFLPKFGPSDVGDLHTLRGIVAIRCRFAASYRTLLRSSPCVIPLPVSYSR